MTDLLRRKSVIVLTILLVSCVYWQYVVGRPETEMFDARPYQVIHVDELAILLSEVSLQERHRAAHADSGTDHVGRELVDGRLPEFDPVVVRDENGDELPSFVATVPYQHRSKDKEILVRVIVVGDKRLLRTEPGTVGPPLISNRDETYYVFEDHPFLYGVEPDTMAVSLLTPAVMNGTEVWDLQQSVSEMSDWIVTWSAHPRISPDGRFIAYTSDRRTLQQAVSYGDFHAVQHALDVWVIDRYQATHKLVAEHGGWVTGWLNNTMFVSTLSDRISICDITDGVRSIPGVEPGTSVLAVSDRFIALHYDGSGVTFVCPYTLDRRDYGTDWNVAALTWDFAPNGKLLPVLESRSVSSDKRQRRVIIVDACSLEARVVYSSGDDRSINSVSWLDNERLLLTIFQKLEEVPTEYSIVVSLQEGELK